MEAVPEVVEGFTIRPLAPLNLPTSLTFGPGDNGSPDLYATTISRTGYEPSATNQVGTGQVRRVHVEYTPTGPVARNVSTPATDLTVPLGIAFKNGEMFVSDKHNNPNVSRENGVVHQIADDGSRTAIVDGLPLGAHDTNHMEIGPDGKLYIMNGSSTCNGQSLGPQEIHPYNGSILRVDPAKRKGDPAVLEWVDGNGDPIEAEKPEPHVNTAIAEHPVNDDFNSKVDVVARGFRNIFGIAFNSAVDGDTPIPYTGMNGSQDPASQDVFYRVEKTIDNTDTDDEFGPDYGYPFVFNRTANDADGTGGETDNIDLKRNAVYDDINDVTINPADYVPGDGLMGWHVCAVGLDFATMGAEFSFPSYLRRDAFIGECGAFEPQKAIEHTGDSRDTRNTGHKVTRVGIDDQGFPTGFHDFVTGLSLPTDVEFGPEGAMYIADINNGVYVVQPTPAADL